MSRRRTVLLVVYDSEKSQRLLASVGSLANLCLHARTTSEARSLLRALPIDVLLIDPTLYGAAELAASAATIEPTPRVFFVGEGSGVAPAVRQAISEGRTAEA